MKACVGFTCKHSGFNDCHLSSLEHHEHLTTCVSCLKQTDRQHKLRKWAETKPNTKEKYENYTKNKLVWYWEHRQERQLGTRTTSADDLTTERGQAHRVNIQGTN